MEYQRVLRRAFLHYGLPEQSSLDHESAFYDNKSASPFPSLLNLWLIGLGVQARFIHRRPPLEHAQIERHHQTIARQVFAGQRFANVTALQCHLQARILFLNQDYPTHALDGQPALQAFSQARLSGRSHSPDAAEQMLDMQRIYGYLQSGRWFRQVSSVGAFPLGGYAYNLTTRFADQTVEITFESAAHQLICLPVKGTAAVRFSIQVLTNTALIGNALPLPAYTTFQLALLFAYSDTTL